MRDSSTWVFRRSLVVPGGVLGVDFYEEKVVGVLS